MEAHPIVVVPAANRFELRALLFVYGCAIIGIRDVVGNGVVLENLAKGLGFGRNHPLSPVIGFEGKVPEVGVIAVVGVGVGLDRSEEHTF